MTMKSVSWPSGVGRLLVVGVGLAAAGLAVVPGDAAHAGPGPAPLPSVTVTKAVYPTSLPSWSIDFTISPDPDGVGGQPAIRQATKAFPAVTWTDLTPGVEYTISETLPTGWTVPAADQPACFAPPESNGTNINETSVKFTPQLGQTWNCGFDNVAPARLLAEKWTTGGFGGPFTIEAFTCSSAPGNPGEEVCNGKTSAGTVPLTTTQANQYSPTGSINLPNGIIRIEETGMPEGYALWAASCTHYNSSGSPVGATSGFPATFQDVEQGDTLDCGVTNFKLAKLTVTKTVVGPAPWSFDITVSPDPGSGFNGTGSSTKQVTNLTPSVSWYLYPFVGPYTVTEIANANYSSSAMVCTGDTGPPPEGPSRAVHSAPAGNGHSNPSDTVTPNFGDTINCAITNNDLRASDLVLTKTADVDQAGLDGTVTWTVHVVNSGFNAAANVVVNDTLPLDLQLVGLTAPAGWDCSESAPGSPAHVGCKKASMAVAESADIVVTTKVIDLGTAEITNCAFVGTSTPELSTANNSDCDSIVVEDLPETGSDPLPMAWVGVGLVGLGGILTVFNRRRRAHA